MDRPWKRTFLGYTFSLKGAKVKVSEKALTRLKEKVRGVTRRTRGHKLSQVIDDLKKILLEWKAYFDRAEVLSPLRDLDNRSWRRDELSD